MRDPVDKLFQLLRELKRRKVYQVALTYLLVAFVGLEAVGLLIPATSLPDWADELLIAVAIVGFPIAVVVAWAFELTSEGIRREVPERGGEESSDRSGPHLTPGSESSKDTTSVIPGWVFPVVILVVGAGAGWLLLMPSGSESVITDRSIAVLPFETLGQAETASFADGVHGDLLTRLSHVLDLSVISRTSVLRYRNVVQPLPATAEELGVAWILHGEVQQIPGEVQVNARLVDAGDDRQVWANSYRRELTAENLFDIQAEITRQIVSALHARLLPREEEQVDRIPTENLDAYRLHAQGREELDRRDEEGFRQALEYFQQAVAADSTYALAWVGMADAWTLLYSYRYAHAREVLPRAEEAVRRALELNPRSAEAHASLGLLHNVRSDGEASQSELERAIELRPGYAEAHNWLSYGALLQGQAELALERSTRAVELNPLSAEAVSNLSLSFLAMGEAERALIEARRVIQLQDSWTTGYFYEGLALYELGRFDKAQATLLDLDVPWAGEGPRATLALAYLGAGDSVAARAVMNEIDFPGAPFALGLLHLAFSDWNRAFDSFERVESWGDWPMLAVYHLYDHVWEPVRDDPRYAALLRNLEEHWQSATQNGDRPG